MLGRKKEGGLRRRGGKHIQTTDVVNRENRREIKRNKKKHVRLFGGPGRNEARRKKEEGRKKSKERRREGKRREM